MVLKTPRNHRVHNLNCSNSFKNNQQKTAGDKKENCKKINGAKEEISYDARINAINDQTEGVKKH